MRNLRSRVSRLIRSVDRCNQHHRRVDARRIPNGQHWVRTSPRATGVRKKKGVDPAIAALQTQLSRTTGEIGERLGVASESVGQAQSTAQAALHHAQAAQAESAQMRSMIDETLRAHFAQTSVDTQSKLDAVAASLAQQLVHATETTQRTLAEKHTAEVERFASGASGCART